MPPLDLQGVPCWIFPTCSGTKTISSSDNSHPWGYARVGWEAWRVGRELSHHEEQAGFWNVHSVHSTVVFHWGTCGQVCHGVVWMEYDLHS